MRAIPTSKRKSHDFDEENKHCVSGLTGCHDAARVPKGCSLGVLDPRLDKLNQASSEERSSINCTSCLQPTRTTPKSLRQPT
jgi:hypothetical protein